MNSQDNVQDPNEVLDYKEIFMDVPAPHQTTSGPHSPTLGSKQNTNPNDNPFGNAESQSLQALSGPGYKGEGDEKDYAYAKK